MKRRPSVVASNPAASVALRSALLKIDVTPDAHGRVAERRMRCMPTGDKRHSGTAMAASMTTSGWVMRWTSGTKRRYPSSSILNPLASASAARGSAA